MLRCHFDFVLVISTSFIWLVGENSRTSGYQNRAAIHSSAKREIRSRPTEKANEQCYLYVLSLISANLPSLVCSSVGSFPEQQLVNWAYLRNRKHVPCFYRVIQTRVEVWENKKCCGNTSRKRVFPQLFRVLPNFHMCFYNSTETRSTCFLSYRKQRDEKKENNLLTLIIKM